MLSGFILLQLISDGPSIICFGGYCAQLWDVSLISCSFLYVLQWEKNSLEEAEFLKGKNMFNNWTGSLKLVN